MPIQILQIFLNIIFDTCMLERSITITRNNNIRDVPIMIFMFYIIAYVFSDNFSFVLVLLFIYKPILTQVPIISNMYI